MHPSNIRIGLTADLFDTNGSPMFGRSPLELFADAGLRWEILPPSGASITADALRNFDALFIGGGRVTEEALTLDNGRLRVLARNGVGYDAVDLAAVTRRGILVTNTPIAVRHSVATTAMAFILALSLKLPLKSRLPREGRWSERADHPGVGLPGRSIGIVGFGGIGQEIARLMQPFGLRTLVADPFASDTACAKLGVTRVPLDTLLSQADFAIVACLLDETTRHLINADRLALMKSTAYLINIARGPIIDEAALVQALRNGAIAGAALDVFEKEPPDPENPLFFMDNVITTPHSLCWTDTFLDDVARSAIRSIVDVIQGRLPEHIVNRSAIDTPRVRNWLRK